MIIVIAHVRASCCVREKQKKKSSLFTLIGAAMRKNIGKINASLLNVALLVYMMFAQRLS